ncbi:MAG: hypothetical protein IPH38_15805 [Candidatus Microthrix sp.]|nr:hypothetical protein [Candidatus Microthrix sp.]MBK7021007.1 hypothetical protein [Candidatus Microthrix sp.]
MRAHLQPHRTWPEFSDGLPVAILTGTQPEVSGETSVGLPEYVEEISVRAFWHSGTATSGAARS